MNTRYPDIWNGLRAAYRPETPELDTAAIMAAVRREAAAHPRAASPRIPSPPSRPGPAPPRRPWP
jgi:hypothetical protein